MNFRTDREGPRFDIRSGAYEFDVDDEDFYNLIEELLDEATWKDQNIIEQHYNKHVLHPDEKFDPNDPKFNSNMTIQDYKFSAERLSREPAGKHDDKQSNVIGFELLPVKYREHNSPRYVKIRRYVTPKYFPEEARGDGNRYREAVIYVDQEGDNNIISYMIIKQSRFNQYVNNLFSKELPENT